MRASSRGRGVPKSRSDARARGGNDRKKSLPFLLFVLGWTPRDAVAFVLGTAAVVAIVVNVLFMQLGSHPAPLWMPAKVEKATQSAAKPAQVEPLPRVDTVPAPVTPKHLVPHALRTPKEIITDIQRELARRGFMMAASTVSMARARTVQSGILSKPQASSRAHSPMKRCSRPLRGHRRKPANTPEAVS